MKVFGNCAVGTRRAPMSWFQCLSSIMWSNSRESSLQTWWNSRWFCGEVPGKISTELMKQKLILWEIPGIFSDIIKIKVKERIDELYVELYRKRPGTLSHTIKKWVTELHFKLYSRAHGKPLERFLWRRPWNILGGRAVGGWASTIKTIIRHHTIK